MPLLYGVSATSLRRLQGVVNASIRMIHGEKKMESISAIALSEGWLSIEHLIQLCSLLLLFSVLKYGKPTFLRDLVHNYEPTRHLRSSDAGLLVEQRSRLRGTENVPLVSLLPAFGMHCL